MTVYPPAMPTPKGDDMLLGVVKQHLPGSARARFPFTRPVQQGSKATTGGSNSVAVVVHGDDGTVGRPAAAVVMWVGAASPDNALDYDFWYDADL